jgi:hypothetical protein
MQVEYCLSIIDAKEIVFKILQPQDDATAEELRLDRKIVKNAFAILI